MNDNLHFLRLTDAVSGEPVYINQAVIHGFNAGQLSDSVDFEGSTVSCTWIWLAGQDDYAVVETPAEILRAIDAGLS